MAGKARIFTYCIHRNALSSNHVPGSVVNVIHQQLIKIASLFLVALFLTPQAAAGTQWDGTGSMTPTGGTVTIDLTPLGLETFGGSVAPGVGQGVMTWYGSQASCGSLNIRNYHFSFETTLGTVKGSGLNEQATWTWNGMVFEGTVSAAWSYYPQGQWIDYSGDYYLNGASPVSGINMGLHAYGIASGTYTQTTC